MNDCINEGSFLLMYCPACNSKSVGKIGVNQYYCWDCFVEFNDKSKIFFVEEDGTLVSEEEALTLA